MVGWGWRARADAELTGVGTGLTFDPGAERTPPCPTSRLSVAAQSPPSRPPPAGRVSQRNDLGTGSRGRYSIGGGTPLFDTPLRAPSIAPSIVDQEDIARGGTGDGGQVSYIWGTTVNVEDARSRLRRFIEHFDPEDRGVGLYDLKLRECFERDDFQLDVDCKHLHGYDPQLYKMLVSYPQEIIPLMDAVCTEYFAQRVLPQDEMPPDENWGIQVRTYNLKETRAMRDLNPSDIDKLVAVRGMVTRVSAVIPDLKATYFQCSACEFHPPMALVDRGRVNEPPLRCQSCNAVGTQTLVHNLCHFANKQQIKMQETPDAIPEGETPHTVSMCVFDSLVDEAKPGDRVEVTGVYRAVPIRVAPNQRVLKAVYKTYVDVIHIRKDTTSRGPKDEIEFTDERIAEFEAMGKNGDIYERLVASLAPSIWEMEEVKKGLLCQLFGATSKTFKGSTSGNKVRGDINVILVGDPGVSKSQLLTYVNKVAPRGIYTSGRGSSAVGLTAYVQRDPETKDMVLESGALVLSDRGICCIDEFDKMGEGARSTLHEVMEQQTVSIAKAGIIAVLNARTSVLASANPVGSRYNPAMSVVDNIQLPPTLLSRFDLIYLVLDKPNPETDRRLARHLVSLHFKEPPPRAKASLDASTLTEYISYARSTYFPILNNEAAEVLVEGYVDMRRVGSAGGRKTITATPRQLESLIRISESLARMRLSNEVEKKDAEESLRLMRVAMQQAAMDPKTGQIDMDKILTGHSASDRMHRTHVADAIQDILSEMGTGKARLSELVSKLKERNSSMEMSIQECRDAAMSLVEQDRAMIKGDLVTLV
ncbi:predicted protein [Micromonas commoda]|uniref:DNA replication licensing factor MCM4 n=1 Tax=Micromonas commoda (strain RCC299 / NOUM17 / CCMP2709) TaxID=296587 RepID=C1EF87_MICCC|nr:predicted protein [Micromonas commoda]ACO66807.1 predicted protein [Micromonas commoda]|eukprot:XP_002505549.1 predicted protein [Micromonas commoda]